MQLEGKTTFFVANQAKLEEMPAEKLKALENEHQAIDEGNNTFTAELKALTAGTLARWSILTICISIDTSLELTKLKNTPTDAELSTTLKETTSSVRLCSYICLDYNCATHLML